MEGEEHVDSVGVVRVDGIVSAAIFYPKVKGRADSQGFIIKDEVLGSIWWQRCLVPGVFAWEPDPHSLGRGI